jgi:peptidoglycan/LPS O-acetylase OafA/YrhL
MIGTLRLNLALIVCLCHLGPMEYEVAFCRPAIAAVWMFYLLSGYLMVLLTQERYQGQRWLFLAHRALRIYPIYWIVLAFSIWGYAHFGIHPDFQGQLIWPPPANILAQWLLVIDIYSMPWVAVPVAWTLTVELAWYFAIAFGIFDNRRQTYVLLAVIAIAGYLHSPQYFSIRWAAVPFAIGGALYWIGLKLPRDKGWAVVAGALSYPVFLIHYTLGSFLAIALGLDRGWPLFGITMVATFVLSWGLIVTVERPVNRMRGRLTKAFQTVY